MPPPRFWKLRQSEWEPYLLLHSPLRILQGQLTDPLYCDFIISCQAFTASAAMREGRQVGPWLGWVGAGRAYGRRGDARRQRRTWRRCGSSLARTCPRSLPPLPAPAAIGFQCTCPRVPCLALPAGHAPRCLRNMMRRARRSGWYRETPPCLTTRCCRVRRCPRAGAAAPPVPAGIRVPRASVAAAASRRSCRPSRLPACLPACLLRCDPSPYCAYCTPNARRHLQSGTLRGTAS